MNGLRGSDLVPGTGRDTLTAEGGGAVRFFWGGGRSRGMLGEVSRRSEDGWVKGWMEVGRCRLKRMSLFILQAANHPSPSSASDVLVPSYVICLGEM